MKTQRKLSLGILLSKQGKFVGIYHYFKEKYLTKCLIPNEDLKPPNMYFSEFRS